MRIRSTVLLVAAVVLGFGSVGADAAAKRKHVRHGHGMDVHLVRPRPAPVYYGRYDDRPDAPRFATRQRSWFQQGPLGSINDSLEGLPPNVIDPPNVRSSGDRFR